MTSAFGHFKCRKAISYPNNQSSGRQLAMSMHSWAHKESDTTEGLTELTD